MTVIRKTVPDLLPGTQYAVRMRSKNATTISNYSLRKLFTTTVASDAPSTPTNVTWVVSGDSFHGEWDAVTTNGSGGPTFVVRYGIQLVSNGVTRVIAVVPNDASSRVTFDFSFEMNRALFGSPQPSITMSVRAIDNHELKSAYSAGITATNPAPAPPTAAVVTPGTDSLDLSWTPPSDTDLIGYNVYVGITAGFTVSTANRIYSGFATRFTYTTTTYTTQYFKIRAVDKFNQESIDLAASGTPISPYIVDNVAPAVPTALLATITNNSNGIGSKAATTWTMTNPPSDLAGFNIRYRPVSTTNYAYMNGIDSADRAASVVLDLAYTNYEFQIQAYDFSYNRSAWSSTYTATSPTNAAPANVSGLTSVAGSNNIIYAWTAVADNDIKNYEVTFSTSATFASGNITYLTGSASTLTVGGLSAATTYYARVRAVDTGGLNSASWSGTDTKATTSPAVSDGNPPASSPTPTITGGLGYLFVAWTAISNSDTVTYEVHISTTTGFTPGAGTKVAETGGTNIGLENNAAGAALVYGTTYYVKLIAKDRDGAAAAGAQASGSISKVGVVDSALIAADVGAYSTTATDTLLAGKNKVTTSSTAPSSPITNDVWIDSANGNIMKTWNGSSWVSAQDAAIAVAQTTATGKNTTFIQSTTPTATRANDQWIDTGNGNILKTWNGSAWVSSQDAAIATAQSTATTAQTVATGKNTTFIQGTAPTATAIGDIWIDTANGNIIKTATATGSGSWVARQDVAITTAQTTATSAQTTANGKNKVTYSTAGPGTTTNTAGDIWFQTSGTAVIAQYQGNGGTSWTSVVLDNAVISTLDAAKITTGVLAAARISAGSITTDKLTVAGVGESLILNGNMTDLAGGVPIGWTPNGAGVSSLSSLYTSSGLNYARVQTNATGSYAAIYQNLSNGVLPVAPGQQYYVEATVIGNGGVYTWTPGFYFYDRDGGYVSSVSGSSWSSSNGGLGIRNGDVLVVPSSSNIAYARTVINLNTASADYYIGAVTVTRVQPGVRIQDGAITAVKVAANTITATQIAGQTITAGQIASGTITSAQIAASTITADKLLIGVGMNVVANAGFETGSITPHVPQNATALNIATTNTRTGGYAAMVTCPATSGGYQYMMMVGGARLTQSTSNPVFQGDVIHFEAWIRTNVMAAGSTVVAYIDSVNFLTSTVVEQVYSSPVSPTGTYQKVSLDYTVPAGVTHVQFAIAAAGTVAGNTFLVDDMYMAKKVSGEIIVNGSVTATQMAANTITAGQIAAGTITSSQIAANTITTDKLLVANLSNLLEDPGFENAAIGTVWTNGPTTSIVTITGANGGTKALQIGGNGSYALDSININYITVIPGETYYFSTRVRKVTSGTVGTILMVATLKLDSSIIAYSTPCQTDMTTLALNTWVTIGGQFTIPAGTNRLTIGASIRNDVPSGQYLQFDDMVLRKAADASLIVDGTITGTKIVAGSVTTDKLTVGSLGSDLVREGGFEEVTTWGITNGATVVAGAARSGTVGLRCVAGGGNQAYSPAFPLSEGTVLAVSGWAIGRTTPTGLYLRIRYLNSSGTEIGISDPINNNNVPTAWTFLTGQSIAAPAGTVNAQFQIYNVTGAVDVDDISVRPVVISAQIQDGAINAQKILAGSITAEKLTIGSVVRGLVLNGSFDSTTNGVPDGWALIENGGIFGVATVAGSPSPGNVASLDGSGSGTFGCKGFRIVSGRQYRVKFSASHSNANGTQTIFRMNYGPTLDTTGTQAGYVMNTRTSFYDFAYINNTALNGVWVGYEYIWTAPASGFASMTFLNYNSTGTLYIDEVTIDEVIVSAQIADGAITASKILAGSVTANSLSVVMGGGNLLANGGFEGDYNGWTLYGTGNAGPYTPSGGLSSRAFYAYSGGADSWLYQTVAPLLKVGQQYIFSAWVLKDAGAVSSNSNVLLAVWDNTTFFSNTTLATTGAAVDFSTLTAGSWQRVLLKFTATNTSGQARLYTSVNSIAIRYDNVQLEQGDVATAYAPKPDEVLPGTIVANMIVGGTISGTEISGTFISGKTFTVGTGGYIQSSNYVSNTTGWRINTTGLEMNDSGSTIKADAIKAGTLGGSGGSGVIQVAAGTSLNFNGGYAKSNTYTGTTAGSNPSGAGFYIGNDGLRIDQGTISAAAFAGGSYTTGTITMAGGSITGGSWTLNSSGLTIPNGGISAASLNLQVGAKNLVPGQWSNFELPSTFYGAGSGNGFTGGTGSTSVVNTIARYSSQSLRVSVTTTAGTANGYYEWSAMEANSVSVPVSSGKTYIVSTWVYQEGGVANDTQLYPILYGTPYGGSYRGPSAGNYLIPVINTWTRMSWTFTADASEYAINLRFRFVNPSTTGWTGKIYYLDGVQVEEQMSNSSAPSTYADGSMTQIDGGMIKTGSIISNTNTTVNGTSIPIWSIPLSGAASFANLQVRGNAVVGAAGGADGSATTLSSSNFITGTQGWQVRSDGLAEFRQVLAGSFDGAALKVSTIQADKLTIANLGGNLVLNPRFTDYTYLGGAYYAGNKPAGWGPWDGAYIGGVNLNANYPGGVSLVVLRDANGYGSVQSTPFPVTEGDIYAASALMSYAGSAPGAYFRLSWKNSSGAEMANNDILSAAALSGYNSDTLKYNATGSFAAPVGARTASVVFYNFPAGAASYLLVNDVSVQRQLKAVHIADGALDARTLTGNVIQTAVNVGPGVAGLHIGHDVTGGHIKGYAGINGEIPSTFNPQTISGYPALAITSGNIPGNAGSRILLKGEGYLIKPDIVFTGTGGTVDFTAMAGISTKSISANFNTNPIDITGISMALRLDGGSNIAGKLSTAFASATGVSLAFYGTTAVIGTQAYNSASPSAANTGSFHAADIHSWSGGLAMEDLTNGGIGGASISNNGRVIRTSTRTMKKSIKEMTDAEAHSVLGIKSYTGMFKDSVSPNDPRRYPFFIAEQAAEVGAELWVGRQHTDDKTREDNREGEVIYFRTGEVTIAHNALIKELFDHNAELESRLGALENSLT